MHQIEESCPLLGSGADVEVADLVGALGGVAGRQLDRVTLVHQIDEVDPLHDASTGDVETGYDPRPQHHTPVLASPSAAIAPPVTPQRMCQRSWPGSGDRWRRSARDETGHRTPTPPHGGHEWPVVLRSGDHHRRVIGHRGVAVDEVAEGPVGQSIEQWIGFLDEDVVPADVGSLLALSRRTSPGRIPRQSGTVLLAPIEQKLETDADPEQGTVPPPEGLHHLERSGAAPSPPRWRLHRGAQPHRTPSNRRARSHPHRGARSFQPLCDRDQVPGAMVDHRHQRSGHRTPLVEGIP